MEHFCINKRIGTLTNSGINKIWLLKFNPCTYQINQPCCTRMIRDPYAHVSTVRGVLKECNCTKKNACNDAQATFAYFESLKESVILTTSFHDINQKLKKKLVYKTSVVSNFIFTSYASLAYRHKLSLVDKSFCKKWLSFHKEMVSAILWGNVLLGGELQKGANNSYFEIFENALHINLGVSNGHSHELLHTSLKNFVRYQFYKNISTTIDPIT